jgi:predicted nuclease with TOPRIM domain
MDWLIWVSVAALALGVWHEINRFPATGNSLRKLQEALDDLQSENEDLKQRLSTLEDDYQEVSEQLDRIRDSAYWRAIDEKDGDTLYELDKQRGNI